LAVYVATWHDRPVATASSRWLPHLFPGAGYVHWVGTHPDHARRGLGTALMIRLLQDFRDRGYRDAVLQTDDVRVPALKTYLRCGFLPVYDVNEEDHHTRWAAIFQAIFDPRDGDCAPASESA
jgi:mycothiol synthase